MSYVVLNGAILSTSDVKYSLASNQLLQRMGKNEIPSTIPKKCIKFLRHTLQPRGILKSLRNSMRSSKTLFVNLVLRASNHMMVVWRWWSGVGGDGGIKM